MTVSAACIAFHVSRRTYYRWRPGWGVEGEAGLADRSSRPARSPRRVGPDTEGQVTEVRETTGWGSDRIGALLGLPASTCHRVLDRLGYPERTRVPEPRLVYAELLPDEKGRTAAGFLVRAVRWFRDHGIAVVRLLTDNGTPYRRRVFARTTRRLGLRHSRTRPYRPQTNGKAERWIRTVLSECLSMVSARTWASADGHRQHGPTSCWPPDCHQEAIDARAQMDDDGTAFMWLGVVPGEVEAGPRVARWNLSGRRDTTAIQGPPRTPRHPFD